MSSHTSSDNPNLSNPATERYMSKTITLVVGEQNQQYVIHKSLLQRSPVLAKMSEGDFLESSSGIIKLPEDEPDMVSCIVDYLYRGDFNFGIDTEEKSLVVPQSDVWSEPARKIADDMDAFDTNPMAAGIPNDTETSVKQTAARYLAKLYVVAEKYQLREMHPLILKKMASCIDLEKNPEGFLDLATTIYDGTPDSDTTFRPYFRDYCPAAIRELVKQEEQGAEVLDSYVSDGGPLAVDIFRGWRRLWRLQHDLGRAQGSAPWFSQTDPDDCCQVANGQWEHWMKTCESFRYEHAVRHPRCSADHVENEQAREYLTIGWSELDRFKQMKERRKVAVATQEVATQEKQTWGNWMKSLLGY